MKHIFLKLHKAIVIVVLFLTTIAFGQDFSRVDEIVRKYPKSFTKVEDLAKKIKEDFQKEDDIARASYTWIALNIMYDVKSYYSQVGGQSVSYSFSTPEEKLQKEKRIDDRMIDKALRSRKAICQGYATLFQRVCELNGIETAIVTGNAKTNDTDIGKLPEESNHAWNAVKIDGKWKLVDVTWAAGSLDVRKRKFIPQFNEGYFFTHPDLFFLQHFPDNSNWLFTNKTKREFADLPLYHNDYLNAGYIFLSPEQGILTSQKSDVIPFRIRNLNPELLLNYNFAFSNDQYSTRILPQMDDDIATFEIKMNARSNGYLTIFINNEAAVTYKIQR